MNLLYRLQQAVGMLVVVWTLGVALYLLFGTEYAHGISATSYADGTTVRSTFSLTFWEAQGWWGIVVLAVPIALASFGARGIWNRRLWQIWSATLLMSMISGLWLFSIGLFYAPAALLLLLMALVATVQTRINRTLPC